MEPNPKNKRSRANVSVSEPDGGVYDLPHSIESGSVPAGENAAQSIDPAIQPNNFPVDSYQSKTGPQLNPPLP